jgi:hypothetical protein
MLIVQRAREKLVIGMIAILVGLAVYTALGSPSRSRLPSRRRRGSGTTAEVSHYYSFTRN